MKLLPELQIREITLGILLKIDKFLLIITNHQKTQGQIIIISYFRW